MSIQQKKKQGYEIIKLVEQNNRCHMVMDYAQGELLIKWIRMHPVMRKEELLDWIRDLTRQLAAFHQCKGNPCYQYLNPYSILVKENGGRAFLDLKAKSNEAILRQMQRRVIRNHFLPPQQPFYQFASIDLDIYGLGKVIQFLLSQIRVEPEFSKWEILTLQKMLRKCLNTDPDKQYQTVKEIIKDLPKKKKTPRKREDAK